MAERKESKRAKLDAKALLSVIPKHWHLFVLLAIFLMAYWVRIAPARFDEIQDLDSYYMLRMSEYAATHGLTLPAVDTMRFFPNGVDPYQADFPGPVFMPAAMYIAMNALGISMHFIRFAIIFPAIMGSLAVLAMYLFSKQLFSRRTALIASFFFATIPAFMTRTTAGVLEKEPIGGVFIPLTMWLFVLSYKATGRKSWIYGVLAGLSFAALGLSWGGSRILYILLPAYALVMMLINRNVDRLVPAYLPTSIIGILLPQVYPFHAGLLSATMLPCLLAAAVLVMRFGAERSKLVKAENLRYVVPAIIIFGVVSLLVGSVFYDPFTHFINDLGRYFFFDMGVLGSTVAEQMHGDWSSVFGSTSSSYTAAPLASYTSIWIFAFLGFAAMAASMGYAIFKRKPVDFLLLLPLLWFPIGIWGVFYMVRLVILFAFPAAMLAGFLFGFLFDRLELIAKGPEGRDRLLSFGVLSVAASAILYVLSQALTVTVMGWLTWLMLAAAALNVCVLAGLFVLFRKRLPTDYTFLLMLVYACMAAGLWFGLSSVSASAASASLIIGPPLFFAFLFAALFVRKKMDMRALGLALLSVFMAYAIGVNISNAYNYGNALSPIFCFPRDDAKCLILSDDGHSYEFVTKDQPWHQAAEFFVKNTTTDSSILSWWDFGYWFQTRCQRPSIADGGNINASVDEDIAVWFTSPPQNWSQFEPWLDEHRPSYILMDYTLPGKYGAISRIATRGVETKSMQQFPYARSFQQGNRTIVEAWLPTSTSEGVPINMSLFMPFTEEGYPAGMAQLIISHKDQVLQQNYVADYCTPAGIIKLGEAADKDLPGCFAMINGVGVFFIPYEVEHTIFTSLMFMDGTGLPVKKVFDNGLIKIYETKYAVPLNATNSTG